MNFNFYRKLTILDLKVILIQIIPFIFYPIDSGKGKILLVIATALLELLEIIILLVFTFLLIYFKASFIKECKLFFLLIVLLYVNYSISTLHIVNNNTSFSLFYIMFSILILFYYYNNLNIIIKNNNNL